VVLVAFGIAIGSCIPLVIGAACIVWGIVSAISRRRGGTLDSNQHTSTRR
jgi:hypothetical protein